MMKPWMTITIAAVAAALLVAAAAMLIMREADPDAPPVQDTQDEEADVPSPSDEEPGEDDPQRPVGSRASIQVTEAWIDDGDCLMMDDVLEDEQEQLQQDQEQGQDPEEGEEDPPVEDACHRLRVTVTAGADEPFGVGIPRWEAVDDQGETHNASWVRGPEPVDAGGVRSIVVSFELSRDARLVMLGYEPLTGASMSSTTWTYQEDLPADGSPAGSRIPG